MAKYAVATTDEIPPGGRKIVEVAGRSIGVFNVGGEYFALRNRCPHQGAALCVGALGGFLDATVPGEYRYSRKGEILRCPWHGWEFDVRTGQSWCEPAKVRVRAYSVTVERGLAAGDADETGADAGADGRAAAPGLVPGPYVAETYRVTVEREYVVIEVGRQ